MMVKLNRDVTLAINNVDNIHKDDCAQPETGHL